MRKRIEIDEAPTKWYHIRSFNYIYVDTLTQLKMPEIDGVSLTDTSLAYSQMWIVIRQKDTYGKCYQDLYRQWVMQAVCEGLFFLPFTSVHRPCEHLEKQAFTPKNFENQ